MLSGRGSVLSRDIGLSDSSALYFSFAACWYRKIAPAKLSIQEQLFWQPFWQALAKNDLDRVRYGSMLFAFSDAAIPLRQTWSIPVSLKRRTQAMGIFDYRTESPLVIDHNDGSFTIGASDTPRAE